MLFVVVDVSLWQTCYGATLFGCDSLDVFCSLARVLQNWFFVVGCGASHHHKKHQDCLARVPAPPLSRTGFLQLFGRGLGLPRMEVGTLV